MDVEQLQRARVAIATGRIPPDLRPWLAEQLRATPAALAERDALIRAHVKRLGGVGRFLRYAHARHPSLGDLFALGLPIPGERQIHRIVADMHVRTSR